MSKISYNDCEQLVNTTIRFNSKKSFFDLLILLDKNDLTIK